MSPGSGRRQGRCRGARRHGAIRRAPAAFTLIELLIAIAIAGLLAALLLVGVGQVRLRSRIVSTSEKLEAALAGLSRLGGAEGSAAYVLQRRAGLGGVLLYRWQNGQPSAQEGADLDLARKHHFGFPWAQADRIASGDPDAETVPRPGGPELLSTAVLADLEPRRAVRLLALAGTLPPDDPATATRDEAAAAWGSDRSPRAGWNDAWGRPLVLAYGIFQPPTGTAVNLAQRVYQYNRSVYIAAGAPGPELGPPLAADPVADLPRLWERIAAVCQAGGRTWTREGFASPPWQGVRCATLEADGRRWRCFLSAPTELK